MMHPFELLADPIRRRLVEVLAVGEHAAGDLVDVGSQEFGVSRSAVSHHLRILRDNEVVLVAVDNSSRIYRLNPDALQRLDTAVATIFSLWNHRYGSRYQRAPQIPSRANPSAGRPSATSPPVTAEASEPRRRHRAAPRWPRGKSARDDPWRKAVRADADGVRDTGVGR